MLGGVVLKGIWGERGGELGSRLWTKDFERPKSKRGAGASASAASC